MNFSKRMGMVQPKVIQYDSMDSELRNSIWNTLYPYLINITRNHTLAAKTKFRNMAKEICFLLKHQLDEIDTNQDNEVACILKNWFFNSSWYHVYDIVELVYGKYKKGRLQNEINKVLEEEMSAYRIVSGKLIQISSTQEILEIESVLVDDNFPGVKEHLSTALDLMAKKPKPDYRNSIKESISAVESMARVVTGDPGAMLSDALTKLFKHKKLHPALKTGFVSLYGYTSDSDGIRHALMDEPTLTAADARYFMVSCSAFVNYLKSLMPA